MNLKTCSWGLDTSILVAVWSVWIKFKWRIRENEKNVKPSLAPPCSWRQAETSQVWAGLPFNPCSYSTSKFRTSIILNLKHLQQASPSPGEHLGVSCWPHIKIIKACRLFADQNRSKTVAAKCWHQTSAGAGFASQKHAKYQVHQESQGSKIHGFTWFQTCRDIVECRGIPGI